MIKNFGSFVPISILGLFNSNIPKILSKKANSVPGRFNFRGKCPKQYIQTKAGGAQKNLSRHLHRCSRVISRASTDALFLDLRQDSP